MPVSQSLYAMIGAGVFGIVCAATLYVVEHYRQDRRRHAMAKDLARLDTELAILRKELNALLAQQKQKYFHSDVGGWGSEFWGCRVTRRAKRSKSVLSSSTTTEDYASVVDADSSDLEFYDVSDDEGTEAASFDMDLERTDQILEDGSASELSACLQQLKNLSIEFPDNPQLLWRLGKAHYRLFTKTEQQDYLTKGIEACTAALDLTPDLANVHKWLAILLGERTQFQPMKEKILDGHLFKKHVDAAVKLDPLDATLHHMLGRFAYDVAELKWYERKVAAALFAEPPTATHEEALEHFLEAKKLSEKDWKENLLFIAKCKIKLGLVEEAIIVLEKAEEVEGEGEEVKNEIQGLLKKHRR